VNDKVSISVPAQKIDVQSNTRKLIKDNIAKEAPVNLFVNNEYVITLLATPQLQKELSLGWLLDEGLLQSTNELKGIRVKQNNVKISTVCPIKKEVVQSKFAGTYTSSGGLSSNRFFDGIDKSHKHVESDYTITARDVTRFIQEFDKARIYRITRGVHIAAIFEREKLVAFAEDIGRHNAVDKAVGIAAESNVEFSNSVLVSSGRQPADMVLKAARIGIPIVISIAAPISSGIAVAEKTGITLVCFVNKRQMKVYTHPENII
jgi:formate dehydrogenase accessory protein FdhD